GAMAQAPFTEEALQRGIDYSSPVSAIIGRGLLLADLDGDGDPDFMTVGAASGAVGVYENDGTGHFADRSASSGIPPLDNASGVIAADCDRDGDLDVYVSRWAGNVLLRNDGGFQFTDVTAAAGVGDAGKGHGCGWADYDQDGWIDLYVANQDGPNRLYRNLGDGTFADVAPKLGVDLNVDILPGVTEGSYQAGFFDYDRDGDADLYVTKMKGYCSPLATTPGGHLFENVGGAFVEISEDAGAEACVDAMCLAIGDFDNNGYQDLYQTGVLTGNSLLLSDGPAGFTAAETATGTVSNAIGWGSVFFDYDNDGWLDLFVCNTLDDERLYRHDGRWPCDDVAAEMGVADAGAADTCAVADIDLDGDLDLFVQVRAEPIRVYVNHEGAQRRWVRLDVAGRGGRHEAVGATVVVHAGGTERVREVIAGSNFKSQNELVQHVGLGAATMIDEIAVSWPGGVERTLTSLPADRSWMLYPPERLGDGDGDGDRDLDDFIVLASCFTGDAPGSLEPGCEAMDHDGDGDVDFADFAQFLVGYDGRAADCDADGTIDMLDVLLGSADVNGNAIPDRCELAAGDVNLDGVVDADDLALVLASWGPCDATPCPGDANGDGQVDVDDLLAVLLGW
ncbi:MAG: FG-GAP-like repeat-containing protein, partial [Planctomycetota bacterium]